MKGHRVTEQAKFRRITFVGRTILLLATCSALTVPLAVAQPVVTTPVPDQAVSTNPLPVEATHDLSMVDPAPLGGAIAVTLPEDERKRLERYEIPELAGSRQALGSQTIAGRLPHPVLDYIVADGKMEQRLSIFDGGLAVIRIAGTAGTIRKRLLLPPDALKAYVQQVSAEDLRTLRQDELGLTLPSRVARLRVYDRKGTFVERKFDPLKAMPKILGDEVMPLQDLLRAMSEDRTITSTVANYQPKVGDELVADDRKIYRVNRIIKEGDIVELLCESQPTKIYVARKDLYNYFVGSRAGGPTDESQLRTADRPH